MARVGIIMGSDSDLPTMNKAAELLQKLDISYEMIISSAHRAPEKTAEYTRTAMERGLEVLIAGAGGAAHLPGVVAAHTVLPVIGVPLTAWATDGMDALLAIAQMPSGVPVATVGIDRARNAAVLAAQILSVGDEQLRKRLEEYKEELAAGVEKKDHRLQQLGPVQYLREQDDAK